jgi:outer membrane protein
VSVEWGHFYFKGVEAGWSFDEIGGFDISAGLRADFTFWDADDSDYLDGMKDRNATAQAGVSVSHKLPGGFEAGLGFWHDVLDVHGGWDVELALSYPIFISRKLMLEPSLGIDLVSEKKARYYYGVFDDEARADRPAYDPGAGWLAGADLTLRYLRSETSSIFLSSARPTCPENCPTARLSMTTSY